MSKNIKVSILIPVYNEEKYIEEALQSVLEFQFPIEEMEVILIDGGSTDRTIEIVERFRGRFPNFKLLHNPARIVPVGMNLGIEEAKGEFIIRLDAHSKYPPDYISKLLYYHQKLGADNVGGRVVARARRRTPTAVAIENLLRDKLGVGSSFRTLTPREPVEVDTVPFGCYRRELLLELGGYDPRLVRNQDLELNKRLLRRGGKIFLIPEIEITYFPRESYRELARNNFQNGYWNILTAYYTGTLSSLSPRHLVPLLFVGGLLLLLLLSPFCPLCGRLFIGILGLYFGIVALRSWKIKRGTTFWHQFWAFPILHFSYGLGSLAGLLEVGKLKLLHWRGKREG